MESYHEPARQVLNLNVLEQLTTNSHWLFIEFSCIHNHNREFYGYKWTFTLLCKNPQAAALCTKQLINDI